MSDNEMMAVAWLTEDGERCVTAKTMSGARKDGGAVLSGLASYTVPAYIRPVLTDEQVREIAEKWSRAWMQDKEIKHVEAMESAIREAIGRGERG